MLLAWREEEGQQYKTRWLLLLQGLAYLQLQQQQWQQAVASTEQLIKVGLELWVPEPTLNGF